MFQFQTSPLLNNFLVADPTMYTGEMAPLPTATAFDLVFEGDSYRTCSVSDGVGDQRPSQLKHALIGPFGSSSMINFQTWLQTERERGPLPSDTRQLVESLALGPTPDLLANPDSGNAVYVLRDPTQDKYSQDRLTGLTDQRRKDVFRIVLDNRDWLEHQAWSPFFLYRLPDKLANQPISIPDSSGGARAAFIYAFYTDGRYQYIATNTTPSLHASELKLYRGRINPEDKTLTLQPGMHRLHKNDFVNNLSQRPFNNHNYEAFMLVLKENGISSVRDITQIEDPQIQIRVLCAAARLQAALLRFEDVFESFVIGDALSALIEKMEITPDVIRQIANELTIGAIVLSSKAVLTSKNFQNFMGNISKTESLDKFHQHHVGETEISLVKHYIALNEIRDALLASHQTVPLLCIEESIRILAERLKQEGKQVPNYDTIKEIRSATPTGVYMR